jgi:hypothetical protein
MTPIINNIVNQAVPNNSISMPMVAAAAAATGVGISRYLNRKGKIR